MKTQCFAINTDLQAELEMPSICNGSDKALANENTLLRTHCCRHKCFPVCSRAQHLLRTHTFVSGTQKMFLILFRNILCPQRMFPSLRSMETQYSFCVPRVCVSKKHHEQQCVRNNVSSFASTYMLQGKLSIFFISIVLELVLVLFLAQCKQTKHAWNNR